MHVSYTLWTCPTVFRCSFFLLLLLFSFVFQFVCLLTYLQAYSFLGHRQSVDEPIKSILKVCYSILICCDFIWLFLQTSISLPILPISLCVLSSFSFRTLNIFIIIILHFLYDHSDHLCHIWVLFWCFLCCSKLCFLLPNLTCLSIKKKKILKKVYFKMLSLIFSFIDFILLT